MLCEFRSATCLMNVLFFVVIRSPLTSTFQKVNTFIPFPHGMHACVHLVVYTCPGHLRVPTLTPSTTYPCGGGGGERLADLAACLLIRCPPQPIFPLAPGRKRGSWGGGAEREEGARAGAESSREYRFNTDRHPHDETWNVLDDPNPEWLNKVGRSIY